MSRRRPGAILSGALVAGVLIATGARAEAQRHPVAPTTIPAIVARAMPAVVSITTRQIERDQFNQPVRRADWAPGSSSIAVATS